MLADSGDNIVGDLCTAMENAAFTDVRQMSETTMKRCLLCVVALASCMVLQAQVRIDTSFILLDPPPRIDLLAVPSAYSYQRSGVFCKLDVQLERRLKMPVLFRLGDVQQVEAWEGKGPLAFPHD
jgi:hypothetical protein